MKKENWNESNIPDQSGKIFIVTGPTSGLGKESIKVLVRKNATIIMAARNIKKSNSIKKEILAENKNAKIDIQELDLSSLESVNNFSISINKKYKALDCLINNAGIMACPYSKTKDGFEIQYESFGSLCFNRSVNFSSKKDTKLTSGECLQHCPHLRKY